MSIGRTIFISKFKNDITGLTQCTYIFIFCGAAGILCFELRLTLPRGFKAGHLVTWHMSDFGYIYTIYILYCFFT